MRGEGGRGGRERDHGEGIQGEWDDKEKGVHGEKLRRRNAPFIDGHHPSLRVTYVDHDTCGFTGRVEERLGGRYKQDGRDRELLEQDVAQCLAILLRRQPVLRSRGRRRERGGEGA